MYNILDIKQSAAKDLRQIPNIDVERILARINSLANDPRPAAAEKLSGEEKYRISQGSYRILYTVEDMIISVTIIKVGHLRDIYR